MKTCCSCTREVLVALGWLILPAACGAATPVITESADRIQVTSPFYTLELAKDRPALAALSADSLGLAKRPANALRLQKRTPAQYTARRAGTTVEYHREGAPSGAPPVWAFSFETRRWSIESRWSEGSVPEPLVLDFNPAVCHVTLLGLMEDDGSVRLPALLHFPGEGTIRITAAKEPPVALSYASKRFGDDFVRAGLPAASRARPKLTFGLEIVAIHPEMPGVKSDPRFRGFRRSWLNIFQLNPQKRVLANNAASDPCAFTLYEYSEIAFYTPPLAKGLTALDLLRQSLDRYLSGMRAYGLTGYAINTGPYDFLDSYPSLIISAWNYVRGSSDLPWLKKRYSGIRQWAETMLAGDRDHNGLIEYPVSGNSGSWPAKIKFRPSNWWDTIGFGHEDAYANALAYHACMGMADLAQRTGNAEDARRYAERARKLRSAYVDTFYNPETGVLAGWKSADGKLHDYYFTFVNGAAITYGLVPREKANRIMDRMLAKMKEVGYNHFEYGLPGNLIPIRREDYVHLDKRWGGPEREDGSDGFQIYENGGATACFVYFTLQALYNLGRREEADAMLFPLLRAYEAGGFRGAGPSGMTHDWKAWDGTPHGYEGFLVDSYHALLAVVTRHPSLK